MKTCIFLLLLTLAFGANATPKVYTVESPSKNLKVCVSAGDSLTWSLIHGDTEVLCPSAISLSTSEGVLGHKVAVRKAKRSSLPAGGNALTLQCAGGYSVEFRVFDDAAAYRFVVNNGAHIRVFNEQATFAFADNYKAFVPYVNDNRGGERWCYSFESYYDEQTLSEMYPDSLAISPLAVCLPSGKKAVIMETGLENYPGMYLLKGQGNSLQAAFPPLPTASEIGGFSRLNIVPTQRANYIAEGVSTLPWRVVVVSETDAQLLGNDITKRLAMPSRIQDASWIRPGKVAWDWWNNRNLTGVDFEAGINTETYFYFIDFAQRNGLEYVIIDEGWSDPEDLLTFTTQIDVASIISYANSHHVGIILWSSWRNLTQQGYEKMDEILAHYEALGVAGFKVDFFDRDDQLAVRSAYQLADCAARHHLLLDLHGLKPFGIEYAYPNILNFEGVKGLENAKWKPRNGDAPLHDQPRYDCTCPYLRNLAGPMDYTPGAMNNATRHNFFGNNDNPMSQGTRVHQMAMYTVFYAPLQMLADAPTAYEKERECLDFLASVPTTWDETIALAGEMGEYAAMARRKGDVWYIGVLNNWTARTLRLDLTSLCGGPAETLQIEAFADGKNAHRNATDYVHYSQPLASPFLEVSLAPGGGFTAVLRQK